MTRVQDIIKKLTNDLEGVFGLEIDKSNILDSILEETPQKISRITSEFRQSKVDTVVTTEIDFLLGYLISFIYHKFLLNCSLSGDRNTNKELSKFLSSLVLYVNLEGIDNCNQRQMRWPFLLSLKR